MASSILGIGVRALNAAQVGLSTAQHNVANVNTPGFHRQQAVQSNSIPQFTGAGFLGQGAQVDTVVRLYSQFLEKQVLQAETQASYFDTYFAQVKQIDSMLADPNSGLSPALQGFFSGVQEVAAYPESIPARQSMLSSAEALKSRFQSLAGRLSEMRQGVNSQLTSSVAEINSYAQRIGDLNEKIALAQASARPTQPANDLLDQREQLIADLNQRVNVTVLQQTDGSLNLFVGNGQPLVVGQTVFQLDTIQSPEDPDDLVVGYKTGKTTYPLNPNDLTGGSLGALLKFRQESVEASQNALGRVAVGLTLTFNAQHRLGMDLNNDLGGDFFRLAATSPSVKPNSNNTGSATMSASYDPKLVSKLTASSYRLTYVLPTDSYTVTELATNTSTSVPASAVATAVPGLKLAVSGTPDDGDSFLVLPTRYGSRDLEVQINDPSKVAAAAPIRTKINAENLGTGKISPGVVIDTTNPAFTTKPRALTPPILVDFTSPTKYSLYDNTDPAAPVLLEAGINYDPTKENEIFPTPGGLDYGYRVSIKGAPVTADKFTIDYNTDGVSDNRNALLLAQLQTKNTIVPNASGQATADYQSAYSQLVSQVGNKTRQIEVAAKAQTSLVSQTKQEQQALSGVNLDEEAANLMRYQQAYQAAAKTIQISDTLFQTLMELGK